MKSKNTIVQRIADFLVTYPPFQYLTQEELALLAAQVEVVYLPQHKYLFQREEGVHAYFYVVEQGAIDLSAPIASQVRRLDICDAGDVLGLRPFFAENAYMMSAQAREDSIVYAIPIHIFKPLLQQNKEVLQFLLESFASNTRNPANKEESGQLISSNLTSSYELEEGSIAYFQSLPYTPNPLCIDINETIQEAACIMTQHGISSLLIEKNKLPIGILTDKDLRTKVATGKVAISTSVREIMSAPVCCISPEVSLAEAQLKLLQHGIGHLCVTADGTNQTNIIGVISEHDIVTTQANNPVALLKKVNRATAIHQLVSVRDQLNQLISSYIEAQLPLPHLLSVVHEIQSKITQQSIVIAQKELCFYPTTSFCWLNLGSQGRGEQLLMTDQDNALVFEDVPKEDLASTRASFLKLSKRVTEILNEIGFEFCPAEMMASNPKWCLSLSEWKRQFSNWIDQPSEQKIMLCSIFFDFSPVFGDRSLSDELAVYLAEKLKGKQKFFAYLGSDALKNPPPLSFFKQFLVETDGQHKDSFDIKSRALMPLIDAARILCLSVPIVGENHTVNRFKALIEKEPQNKSVYEEAIRSFYVLLEMRTREGLQFKHSGRFVSLEKLSKRDRMRLKRSFQPISDLQSFINNRFQLTYFR
jgi:CBS domain-containing protein